MFKTSRVLYGGQGFINNYTLYECTHCGITYSVTAHPGDGQAQPKHVGVTN